jgi:hypothetical protein
MEIEHTVMLTQPNKQIENLDEMKARKHLKQVMTTNKINKKVNSN